MNIDLDQQPARKATGRDIIKYIGQTMERGLEPLMTRTLAPSLYQVYLHPEDHDRLRNVFPEIEKEARAYLDRELKRLNRESIPPGERLRRFLRRTSGEKTSGVRYESTDGGWHIRFQEDPNGQLEPGDVEVVAELAIGEEPTYGSGSQTHRIVSTTRRLGKVTTHERTETKKRPLARIHVEEGGDRRTYDMEKPEIVIGRKAEDAWVDLDLLSSDISREHARIRQHEGSFQIKDLSTNGVEVNGRKIPSSFSAEDGEEKDTQQWVELEDGAQITLASATLRLEITPP